MLSGNSLGRNKRVIQQEDATIKRKWTEKGYDAGQRIRNLLHFYDNPILLTRHQKRDYVGSIGVPLTQKITNQGPIIKEQKTIYALIRE